MRRVLPLAMVLVFAAYTMGLGLALHLHLAEHSHSHDHCSLCLCYVAGSTAVVAPADPMLIHDEWRAAPATYATRPAAAPLKSPVHPRAPPVL